MGTKDQEAFDLSVMPFELHLPAHGDCTTELKIEIKISSCSVMLSPIALYDWLQKVLKRSDRVYFQKGQISEYRDTNLPSNGIVLVDDYNSNENSVFSVPEDTSFNISVEY